MLNFTRQRYVTVERRPYDLMARHRREVPVYVDVVYGNLRPNPPTSRRNYRATRELRRTAQDLEYSFNRLALDIERRQRLTRAMRRRHVEFHNTNMIGRWQSPPWHEPEESDSVSSIPTEADSRVELNEDPYYVEVHEVRDQTQRHGRSNNDYAEIDLVLSSIAEKCPEYLYSNLRVIRSLDNDQNSKAIKDMIQATLTEIERVNADEKIDCEFTEQEYLLLCNMLMAKFTTD